ncbi:MAG TPA: hypothetical protein PKK00_08335 [Bacteroidales bacterium]|nr:hypothetical protein [Bacteroidales bacterium]HPS17209.1 hypothetical protein [Bacteroidales bacterium]
MNLTDLIGTVGVFILLLAYSLNLIFKFSKKNNWYLIMNIFGAALACVASVMLNYIPFVILEGSWTLVSTVALFRKII